MRALCASWALLCLPALARAGPPGLRDADPPAAQRGVESVVRFHGVGLGGGTELVLPFEAAVRYRGGGPQSVSFSIRPAADTPPGAYPVRLRTPEGISNLRLFAVTAV